MCRPITYDEWRERILELASMECPGFVNDDDAVERMYEFLEFENRRLNVTPGVTGWET